MVDKLRRKLFFLGTILVLSIVSFLVLGFRLGLDLRGGTRLTYELDFDRAVEEGIITPEELQNPTELVNSVITIWQKRIDPQGVRGATVRKEGENRITIELPGSASSVAKDVSAVLQDAVGPEDQALILDPNAASLNEFPENGGVVNIGGEKIRYAKRIENALTGLSRGQDNTKQENHDATSLVRLEATDPWRSMIENTGQMEFLIAANAQDLQATAVGGERTDLTAELQKVTQWIDEHPGVGIAEYNRKLSSERTGPAKRLRYFLHPAVSAEQDVKSRLQALMVEEDPSWRFTGSDLQAVFHSVDGFGYPAVGFSIVPEKAGNFGDYTEEHIGQAMAIVINDEIATMPNIEDELPGRGIIKGGGAGFTYKEVQDLIQVLRSGSLRLRPEFIAQETVGATLGADYVRRGELSAGLGLLVVLLWVMFYYRKLGLVAAGSLIFNMVALVGAMAFIRATLTLPGVAGIILTVGMAVDANILIYERIREEQARGRKPLQSAKDGFKNAFSTIVDANLTTLITGLILMTQGTGPVKGFATTLCIGIVTTMISALVGSRVLVHFMLEKGVDSWDMRQFVSKTNFQFMAKAKLAGIVSAVLCVAGLTAFALVPDSKKLGIDFTGGITMRIRTAEPMTADQVRDSFKAATNPLIGQDNTFTQSVEVAPIQNSAEGDGYTYFRVTSKEDEVEQDTIRRDVAEWLQDILSAGPVEDTTIEGNAVSGVLYFDVDHPVADVAAGLATIGIENAQVTEREGGRNVYEYSGTLTSTKDVPTLENQLQLDLEKSVDSAGNQLTLASPISEMASVGAQVVNELRDKALFAVLASLFAAVMYIRVRFAEYSYGLAAVVALVHDVSIALGALALASMTPFVRAEVDLSMIAAFLTIIGYSLNDTIVVFDRIRENLPRGKGSLKEILDLSINQTLSRTLLTSGTTLATVLLLFLFNVGTGNVLEGFSFALLIGVLVGTYSSIFIASPVLYWLELRAGRGRPSDSQTAGTAQAVTARRQD